jgi:hypothetical protein
MFDFERYHFCFRKEEVKEEGRNLWQYENLDINQSLLFIVYFAINEISK